MSVRFELSTELQMPVDHAFNLARNIDAHVGSMARSSERAVAGVTSGLIGDGQRVTWWAVHFGIPLRMTIRITDFSPPRSFVDEQVRGPFRYFRHEHAFHALDGRTLMVDRVSFAAPFGVLGVLAERLVLERYLRRLIEQRNEFLVRTS
jgi:ligand-binding SRPBCC domain-containing protein